ncbi:MAG: zf-HC2 domain-containing protein [Bacteroidales bacterium]|nr:zf-HC2 domain-containing protein [Bacteroidales bacterium]MDD3891202.1 zf-HC2 domain-containing protein [Bacteroidales bacterium]
MEKRMKCAEDWSIQAYIDGELNADELKFFENHLAQCHSCSERIGKRKEKVSDVLGAIELIDKIPIVVRKSRQRSFVRVFSVAAAALIFIVFFVLMQHNGQKDSFNGEQCEWVEVDAANFHPELESPNKLYQMRVTAINEIDAEGNRVEYYLLKQCKEQNYSN